MSRKEKSGDYGKEEDVSLMENWGKKDKGEEESSQGRAGKTVAGKVEAVEEMKQ